MESRIYYDLQNLLENDIQFIKITDFIIICRVYYNNTLFIIKIIFPKSSYPFTAPKIIFMNNSYINPKYINIINGHFNEGIINKCWSPVFTIYTIINDFLPKFVT